MSYHLKENQYIPRTYEPEKESRPSGFTLTETICSLILLGTMLVFMVTSFRLIDHQNRKTDRYQIALNEASNILERLTAEKWENLTPKMAIETKISPSAEKLIPNASLKTEISSSKDSPESRKISVTISFKTPKGPPAPSVHLTSWVYQQESAE